ncbi:MAG: hypothetical protein IJ658_11595 [Kiritimatiellae bacterium]|nr:hypothetical protein [Kiritimatiellia bacterium]
MCELMTIAAALAFTAIYFLGRRSKAVFTTMLMFWGAALMWGVDCVANKMEGEALFDISREDTVLGFIILGAGLLVFAVLCLTTKARQNEIG